MISGSTSTVGALELAGEGVAMSALTAREVDGREGKRKGGSRSAHFARRQQGSGRRLGREAGVGRAIGSFETPGQMRGRRA